MKITKTLLYIGIILSTHFMISCASFQGAGVADANRDGYISSDEHTAYFNRKSIENLNVNTERNKRMNATGAIRDTRNALWDVRSIRNMIRGW